MMDAINNCNERVIKRAYERLEGRQNLADLCQQLKQYLRTQLNKPSNPEIDGINVFNIDVSSLALLLLAICSYRLNDFGLSHLISCFGQVKETNEWRSFEFEWIAILSQQKLHQLQDTIFKIEKFMDRIKVSKNKNQWLQLQNILQIKKTYLYEYMINRQSKINALSDQDKAVLAKKLHNLFKQQVEEKYFEQEGYSAYLISLQWMSRFSLFTKYYEITNESPEQLQAMIAKKNVMYQLNQNSMEDETFVEIFRKYCDQNLFEELEKISNSQQNGDELQMCPIYNDDLVDLYTLYDVDPLKAKSYTNFGLNKALRENQNFIFVSSQVWKLLHSYFGGMEIKRIIVCRTSHQVETHLLSVKCQIFPKCQHTDLHLQFNGNERVEEVIMKVKRIVGQKTRNVWKTLKGVSLDELIQTELIVGSKMNRDQVLEQSELGPEEVLLIELEQDNYRLQEKQNLQTVQIPNKCQYCKNTETQLSLCECRSVKYCNELCQANDLKSHQENCKLILEKDSMITQLAKKYKVKPPVKFAKNSAKGICGLSNLGNTCFMNSSLQCLSNAYELTEYMIYNTFVQDLNEKNPLGTGGKLACNYAELLKELYESSSSSVAPWSVKKVIGQHAPQFNGFSQQDSQELLSYLLDGLHEDLNKIKKKPYLPDLEYKGQSDKEFADLYWENHKKRNDSIITDIFTGQFKSRVECPECQNISITFDPFATISLPIPSKEFIQFSFYFIFRDSNTIPLKISQSLQTTQTAGEVIQIISNIKKIKPEYLKFYHLSDSAITDNGIPNEQNVKQIRESIATIFLYEEYDEKIDQPISKYDQNIQSPYYQVLCNVKKIEDNKMSQNYQRISFTRLCYIDSKTTYSELHLILYSTFRPYILQVIDNYPQYISSKEFEQFLRNAKKFTFKDQKEEYIELMKMRETVYQIVDEHNKPLPYNDKQVEFKGQTVQLTAQFKLKNELLKLNRCQDADFQFPTSSNINQTITLNDCLNSFCQEEVLGVGNEWFCSKCKKHQRAKKQMQIYKAPKILILHLKRFRSTRVNQYYGYSMGGASKIVQFVDCPIENLNIQSYILDKDSSQNYVYDLFAVSNHFGGLGGGHYTAYAKNPLFNAWFDFNDSSVRELRSNPVTEAAYVLFYRRKRII